MKHFLQLLAFCVIAVWIFVTGFFFGWKAFIFWGIVLFLIENRREL